MQEPYNKKVVEELDNTWDDGGNLKMRMRGSV